MTQCLSVEISGQQFHNPNTTKSNDTSAKISLWYMKGCFCLNSGSPGVQHREKFDFLPGITEGHHLEYLTKSYIYNLDKAMNV